MLYSPFPTLFICLFYGYFAKVLGPRLMENRKPFQLKTVLIVYNAIQTVFSAWIFYEVSTTQSFFYNTLSYYARFVNWTVLLYKTFCPIHERIQVIKIKIINTPRFRFRVCITRLLKITRERGESEISIVI